LKTLKAWFAGALLAWLAWPAHAVLFSFSHEFSGSGDVCANGTCATLSVLQNGANVDFLLNANLASGEFIAGLYGNRDPFAFTSFAEFDSRGGTGADAVVTNISGIDSLKADDDGFFDWVWNFNTSGTPSVDGTDTFSWSFFNTSIDDVVNAVSQNGPVGKNGFTFALSVQGLGAGNEGWFDAVTAPNGRVPEPATTALLALALLSMASVMRRRALRR
jgi:hypothetical protein